VPVPLPDDDVVNLHPPDAEEVRVISAGVAGAVTPVSGMSDTQRLLMKAVFLAMTGYPATLDQPTMGSEDLARALSSRNEAFRTRIVQIMVLLALVLRPLPEEVADRVAAYARELSVDEGMLQVARRFAAGSLGLAAIDFERNGYTAAWSEADAVALHTSTELASAWELVVDDPVLQARWAALEELPPGTLGRRVTDFYRARGFAYPGGPGSAPPLLAQHDWVHVLADYGTTVESELEVFSFIARANDDMRAFSLAAMVVSLFETGYLRTGAGLFQADTGHLSESGMAARVADAMRRGALCLGSVDFLRTDWFSLAHLTLDAAREHFGVPPKDPGAADAGSVGPWEPGGISPFQFRAGQDQARAAGRPYEAFGAVPAAPSEPGRPATVPPEHVQDG
jgi:hypothetical protein